MIATNRRAAVAVGEGSVAIFSVHQYVRTVQRGSCCEHVASAFFRQTRDCRVQVDYEDYRDVAGIRFPHRWTFTWLDGRDTFEFADVRFNGPIDAARIGEPLTAAAR